MYYVNLKNARKLYGNDIVKVSVVSISYLNKYYRRIFYCYHKDKLGLCRSRHIYSVYKMEKKLGRLLHNEEEVHHIDKDTLNDKYCNLEVILRGRHTSYHQSGNKHWLGKKHTEKTKIKMVLNHHHLKPMLGKHHNEETKRRMSNARKRYWENKHKLMEA